MTPEQLAKIKARADAATEGPWVEFCGDISQQIPHEETGVLDVYPGSEDICTHEDGVLRVEDIDFIAHARTDIPALVAEVERLQEEVGRWIDEERVSLELDAIEARKEAEKLQSALDSVVPLNVKMNRELVRLRGLVNEEAR